jgi:copper chaperone
MLEFNISTMTCGHCVGAVTRAVQEVDPQARVAIDLPTHRVSIETAATRERVVSALVEAGYEPDVGT